MVYWRIVHHPRPLVTKFYRYIHQSNDAREAFWPWMPTCRSGEGARRAVFRTEQWSCYKVPTPILSNQHTSMKVIIPRGASSFRSCLQSCIRHTRLRGDCTPRWTRTR
ncbi:hypothetical protein PAXRUDRAFT_748993 [Paxillus rubicundulus Ve08.2h10]|uniref:Uncharacterized protein n=1 Tax=Paxillus rubicundulus Ve08.2h10 TaxID=930991 RepID=A0A0D0EBM6_9AGAM|nr:hypothetical protein PAXRUDRAFT_748993 [Paxillus rubicundulus Ve08.2h10]